MKTDRVFISVGLANDNIHCTLVTPMDNKAQRNQELQLVWQRNIFSRGTIYTSGDNFLGATVSLSEGHLLKILIPVSESDWYETKSCSPNKSDCIYKQISYRPKASRMTQRVQTDFINLINLPLIVFGWPWNNLKTIMDDFGLLILGRHFLLITQGVRNLGQVLLFKLDSSINIF